jgi:hypothetical protein
LYVLILGYSFGRGSSVEVWGEKGGIGGVVSSKGISELGPCSSELIPVSLDAGSGKLKWAPLRPFAPFVPFVPFTFGTAVWPLREDTEGGFSSWIAMFQGGYRDLDSMPASE